VLCSERPLAARSRNSEPLWCWGRGPGPSNQHLCLLLSGTPAELIYSVMTSLCTSSLHNSAKPLIAGCSSVPLRKTDNKGCLCPCQAVGRPGFGYRRAGVGSPLWSLRKWIGASHMAHSREVAHSYPTSCYIFSALNDLILKG
jgi:hypothetical protein